MSKLDQGVQLTTMAVRELLMEYFKGSCVDRFIEISNIRTSDVPVPRRYQFERLQTQNERQKYVFIGTVSILTIRQSPDKIVFHTSLERSPQMRELRFGIEKFLDRYLMGVNREYDVIDKKTMLLKDDDSDLMSKAKLRENIKTKKDIDWEVIANGNYTVTYTALTNEFTRTATPSSTILSEEMLNSLTDVPF